MTSCLTDRCHNLSQGSVERDGQERDEDVNGEEVVKDSSTRSRAREEQKPQVMGEYWPYWGLFSSPFTLLKYELGWWKLSDESIMLGKCHTLTITPLDAADWQSEYAERLSLKKLSLQLITPIKFRTNQWIIRHARSSSTRTGSQVLPLHTGASSPLTLSPGTCRN